MPTLLALSPLAAAGAMLAVWLVARTQPGRRPGRTLAAARLGAGAALAIATLAALLPLLHGPLTSPLLGIAGIGLSFRLDGLSAVMLLLVTGIGAVVLRFSARYLDGDDRQGLFMGRLCLTLAAVTLLVTAGNLGQLAIAWIATSLTLHRLLVFYAERPKAVRAARKKAILARLGDLCLILALVLVARAFGTTDIATILAEARLLSSPPAGIGLAALLLALTALLKSAQFPTHGWLTEVMETPTPVSALLHAGIVNAGGFLVIRFADVMLLATPAMQLLALVGGFTALFAAVVMLTQTSIKVSLAWSTTAQMGFMLLQCGLGLWALAVLHIVAHSLYKAHAFLSSGSVVEERRHALPPPARPRPYLAGLAVGLAVVLYLAAGTALAPYASTSPQALAIGTIFVLGLALYLATATAGPLVAAVIGRAVGIGAGLALTYLGLQAGAAAVFAGALPPPPPLDLWAAIGLGIAIAAFALVTLLQLNLPALARRPFWWRVRVHLANGLYANALLDRLLGTTVLAANPTK